MSYKRCPAGMIMAPIGRELWPLLIVGRGCDSDRTAVNLNFCVCHILEHIAGRVSDLSLYISGVSLLLQFLTTTLSIPS